jgi:5-methylthioadenosine/S-adenosylhomocysteine deaminase
MKRSAGRITALLFVLVAALVSVQEDANANEWAIAGTVVTPDRVIADGAIVVSDQRIADVTERGSVAPKIPVTTIEGIVLPGLIDLHNHLTWNILPRWVPTHPFANRYAWQATAEYDRNLAGPHGALGKDAMCEAEIYAEVKAIIGGATSVVGSLNDLHCTQGLVRNLDVDSRLGFTAPKADDPCEQDAKAFQPLADFVDNEVFPMEVPYDRLAFLRCALRAGSLHALVVHLSEGAPNDASARREFRMLEQAGLIMPGLVIDHGTALHAEDFQRMSGKAGLVWSPRSNDELYGDTTNIAAALQQNVSVAIAPDWSPTGSAGMLQEIGYASRRYRNINAMQMVAMATSIPARLARLSDRIGVLAPGLFADFIVMRGDRANPYAAVTQATPADIQLVVIGGQAVYGDPEVMATLRPDTALERIDVCGVPKALYLGDSAAAARHEAFADIQRALNAALARSGTQIGPIECN